MRSKYLMARVCATMLLGLVWPAVQAEDIDIFRKSPDVTGGLPNILFVIDNGASWSSTLCSDNVYKDLDEDGVAELVCKKGTSKSQAIHEALHAVVTSKDFSPDDAKTDAVENKARVRLGLMPFAHSNKPKGGQVLVAVNDLDKTKIAQISCRLYQTAPNPSTGICPATLNNEILPKGNNTPYGLTLNEAYLYFKGLKPLSGLGDGVYSSNNLAGYDPAALDGVNYRSPTTGNSCANNFIIVIGTGDPDNGENNDAESTLRARGGVLNGDPIKLSPDNYQSSWGDEYTRYLDSLDLEPGIQGKQSITTYVIDVFDPATGYKTNPDKAARAYYKSLAGQGQRYFSASNAAEVAAAIGRIVDEIEAVNTVFASVSLPISVNVQGANQNQVYIGMFRPDKSPRWFGNLKRYQYEFDSTTGLPFLAGEDGKAAYNSLTGFIVDSAISYWTKSSTYWNFKPEYAPSDSPDGSIVEKGATAQRLRERSSTAPRNVLTCTDCSGNATLESFATEAAAASAPRTVLAPEVINWVIGTDVQDERPNSILNEVRPSIHGDVLHSRPSVVNYFRTGTVDTGQDVIAFYGANDGYFRAVDGGTGEELWAFVPEEQWADVQRIYDNTAVTGDWHPYFSDGNVVVISQDINKDGRLKSADGDKVWLFISMRRGGRYLYALDVSDPKSPKFMWKISNQSAGFSELGQTWSAPRPAFVRAFGTNKPVLIFGAGYDAVADDFQFDATAPADRPARTQGRGLYMVDAETGEQLWRASANPGTSSGSTTTVSGMDFSIPSELTLVNYSRSAANYAERLYFGDTGGNLWLADISSATQSDWEVRKLANLGGSCTATSRADCRKFLYPPSVVRDQDHLAVLLGSGDREHPFEDAVQNRFYMVKDPNALTTTITDTDLLNVSSTPAGVDQSSVVNGWYFNLRTGEKTVGNAVTLDGVTYFNTNERGEAARDASGNIVSCVGNLGIAREYFVNFRDGSVVTTLMNTRDAVVPGGGFLPPPVSITLIDDKGNPWTGIGGLRPKDVGAGQPGNRQKTYWFKDID